MFGQAGEADFRIREETVGDCLAGILGEIYVVCDQVAPRSA